MPVITLNRNCPRRLLAEATRLTLSRLQDVAFDCSYIDDPTYKTCEGNRCYKPAHHFYAGVANTDTVVRPRAVFTLFLDYKNGGTIRYINTICSEDKALPGLWYAGSNGGSSKWTAQYLSDVIVLALSVAANAITHSEAVKEGDRLRVACFPYLRLNEWTPSIAHLAGSPRTKQECNDYRKQKHERITQRRSTQ